MLRPARAGWLRALEGLGVGPFFRLVASACAPVWSGTHAVAAVAVRWAWRRSAAANRAFLVVSELRTRVLATTIRHPAGPRAQRWGAVEEVGRFADFVCRTPLGLFAAEPHQRKRARSSLVAVRGRFATTHRAAPLNYATAARRAAYARRTRAAHKKTPWMETKSAKRNPPCALLPNRRPSASTLVMWVSNAAMPLWAFNPLEDT